MIDKGSLQIIVFIDYFVTISLECLEGNGQQMVCIWELVFSQQLEDNWRGNNVYLGSAATRLAGLPQRFNMQTKLGPALTVN